MQWLVKAGTAPHGSASDIIMLARVASTLTQVPATCRLGHALLVLMVAQN
jgi:hypothetical protein